MDLTKSVQNITCDLLDLENNATDNLCIENCNIETLILPQECPLLGISDSIVKTIYLNPNIRVITAQDSGIEQVIAKEPLNQAQMFLLNDNKIWNFDVKILNSPWEINLENNFITDLPHKIPYHFYLNLNNNPISDMKYRNEYIDFSMIQK